MTLGEEIKKLVRDVLGLHPNIEPLITIHYQCVVCGWVYKPEGLSTLREGAAYVPPNPVPWGTRVVDTKTGRHGWIMGSQIRTLPLHQHRREVLFLPDGSEGGEKEYFCISKEEDQVTDRFVREEDWEGGVEG